jgi:hypothetical protein
MAATRAAPSEAEVVLWLKNGLIRNELGGRVPREIVVDRDGAYLRSRFRQQLEPMATVAINGWRPDVVCVLEGEQTQQLAAFEVKGEHDHERGVVQAARYGDGAHETYLCVPGQGWSSAWLGDMARRNGVGLLRASPDRIEVAVPAAAPRPNPRTLEATRRNLLGEAGVRSFGLNKPLHYAAALVAAVGSQRPWDDLREVWGLNDSAVRMAARGAETLGLLAAGRPTAKGRAVADTLAALGFRLSDARHLTRSRLVDRAPGFAALLRAVLLDLAPVELIVRALAASPEQPIAADALAVHALAMDEGMARAVFGAPPAQGEAWVIRASTRFSLKAALYDVGILDSPLAKNSSRPQGTGGYEPAQDLWLLGAACRSGPSVLRPTWRRPSANAG